MDTNEPERFSKTLSMDVFLKRVRQGMEIRLNPCSISNLHSAGMNLATTIRVFATLPVRGESSLPPAESSQKVTTVKKNMLRYIWGSEYVCFIGGYHLREALHFLQVLPKTGLWAPQCLHFLDLRSISSNNNASTATSTYTIRPAFLTLNANSPSTT